MKFMLKINCVVNELIKIVKFFFFVFFDKYIGLFFLDYKLCLFEYVIKMYIVLIFFFYL